MDILNKIKRLLKKSRWVREIYVGAICKIRIRKIRKNGLEILNLINNILDNLDIKHFIDFGTLLGFIREKEFIAHDPDIDIGILNAGKSEQKNIAEYLGKKGFKKTHEFKYDGQVVEQAYIKKGVKVDLFYYHHDDVNSFCYLFDKEFGVNYPFLEAVSTFKFAYKKIENIENRIINGIKVSVPKNPEELLEEKYGRDWEKPNKNWIYQNSPSIDRMNKFGEIVKYK